MGERHFGARREPCSSGEHNLGGSRQHELDSIRKRGPVGRVERVRCLQPRHAVAEQFLDQATDVGMEMRAEAVADVALLDPQALIRLRRDVAADVDGDAHDFHPFAAGPTNAALSPPEPTIFRPPPACSRGIAVFTSTTPPSRARSLPEWTLTNVPPLSVGTIFTGTWPVCPITVSPSRSPVSGLISQSVRGVTVRRDCGPIGLGGAADGALANCGTTTRFVSTKEGKIW